MKLIKSSETPKTVVFQSDCIREDISRAIELFSEKAKKDHFYLFKNPSQFFTFINYAGARTVKGRILIPKNITTPPIYMEFENVPTEVTFRVDYWPILRWTFYTTIPITAYSLYQAVQKDPSEKAIPFAVGLGLAIVAFVGMLAFIHEKSITYFFKRDVKRIVNDLNNHQ